MIYLRLLSPIIFAKIQGDHGPLLPIFASGVVVNDSGWPLAMLVTKVGEAGWRNLSGRASTQVINFLGHFVEHLMTSSGRWRGPNRYEGSI